MNPPMGCSPQWRKRGWRLKYSMSQHHYHPHGHNPNLQPATAPVTAPTARKTESNHLPTQDEISKRAYYNYLHEGSKPGNDLFHWLEAEADLTAGCTLLNANNFKRCVK